jgi:Domain of unknown function (DUF4397)
MRLNRLLLAVFCLVPLVLTSCGGSDNSNANMRVVNAFPEAQAIDVTVGGQSIVRTLPFQGLTTYNAINTGSQTFTVAVSGTPTTLINTSNNTTGGNNYTYVVFGPNTAVGALLAADSFSDPGNGFFAIRVINAAAGIGPVDIYVSGPGADINATAPVVSGVAYGVISNFISVTTGASFEVRVCAAGTKDVIYDSTPRTFAEHSGSTFVVFSKESSKLVNVVMLDQNGAGTGSLANNLLAQFKVANASQVTSPLNVFLDGNLQLSNIPYTGVSNYQRVAAGAHSITIEATATPGATLLTLPVTLSPATDTSIPLTGTSGALNGVVLNDDNLPPPIGTAGVRFVNTSADIAAVDVFVNFSKQVSGLAMNAASSYVNFNAAVSTGTTYEFDFNISGTTTVALKLPSVLLTGGHKYTVYLAGPSGTLQGIVTQDY